jgi:alpha-beta hydrolase superfamily lysophospholipase
MAMHMDTTAEDSCAELHFTTDGLELVGWLHRPVLQTFPVVIGVHGLLSDARSPKQRSLAEACRRVGIGYFRFDHRGCGQSQGLMTATTIESRVCDLLAAASRVLKAVGSNGPIGLFGSSLGASVCIAAARHLNPAGMVLYAGPLKSRTIAAEVADAQPQLAGLELSFDLSDRIDKLHHLMVVHGTADEIVPVADAHAIHDAAGSPKRLLLQPGGDHLMSDPDHQARFLKEALEWFQAAFFVMTASSRQDDTNNLKEHP